MKRLATTLILFSMCIAASAGAQTAAVTDADAKAIESLMDTQAAAWNRADIPAFMQVYENSPETTFIGAELHKGYAPILERYSKAYSNAAQMGKLTYSKLEVRLLPGSCGTAEFALVTGNFHLERSAKGEAKKDDGIFSLVWHKGSQGWKIVLDHTS